MGQEVLFRARRVHRLAVLVLGEEGRPLSEAIVAAGRTLYRWTESAPTIPVYEDETELRAFAGVRRFDPECAEAASRTVTVRIADRETEPVRLMVAPRGGVHGRILGRPVDDRPSSGVVAVRLEEGGSPAPGAFERSLLRTQLSGGRYHLRDLTPGTYAVALADWPVRQEPGEWTLARVDDTIVDLDLVIAGEGEATLSRPPERTRGRTELLVHVVNHESGANDRFRARLWRACTQLVDAHHPAEERMITVLPGSGLLDVARFENVASGAWIVSLSVENDQGTHEVARASVETGASSDVALVVPPLHELRIRAPGLSEGTTLTLERAAAEASPFAERPAMTRVDAEHRAVFRDLPAGSYRLASNLLSGVESFDPIAVAVPTYEICLDAGYDCLRAWITDASGLLHEAGLRTNDLVVGADGVAFEGYRTAADVLAGGGLTLLDVVRDDTRLVLRVPRLESLPASWRLGGSLTPARRPRR